MKMSYSDFVNVMTTVVKDYLPDSCSGTKIRVTKINKSDRTYDGMTMDPGTGQPVAVANLNMLYDMYRDDGDIVAAAKKAAEIMTLPAKIDVGMITDYNEVKSKLGLRLMEINGHEDFLKDKLYREVAGLAVLPVIFVGTSHGDGTITFQKDMLSSYRITADEVFSDAEKSPKMTPSIRTLRDTLAETGLVLPDDQPEAFLYVVTTQHKMMGASAIVLPEVQKELIEKLGETVYILPSSIHEVLAKKASEEDDVDALKAMVYEINRAEVAPEDRLYDNVFVLTREGLDLA